MGQPPHVPAECPDCTQRFSDETRLRIHEEGTGHCFCALHNTIFATVAELEAHRKNEDHNTGIECKDCGRQYRTEEDLNQHLGTPAHSYSILQGQAMIKMTYNEALSAAVALATEEVNLRCEECKMNLLDLKQWVNHKKNKKHTKLVDLSCPRSDTCEKKFWTAEDFVYHLEKEKQQCKHGVRTRMEEAEGDDTMTAMDSLSLSGNEQGTSFAQEPAENTNKVAYKATVEDDTEGDDDSLAQETAEETTEVEGNGTVGYDTDEDDEEDVFVLTEPAKTTNKVASDATVGDELDGDDEDEEVVFKGRGVKEEEVLYKPRGSGK